MTNGPVNNWKNGKTNELVANPACQDEKFGKNIWAKIRVFGEKSGKAKKI